MNYRFSVRVYYEDTDAAGIVYYANYFRFMERARTEWLRALGYEQDEVRRRYGLVFVVRHAEADYLRPARFNALLWVDCNLTERGRSSLVIGQDVYRQRDEKLLCRGSVQLVCVDIERFRPMAIPAEIVEKMNEG
jgi:acyl-CoA thioester hydrolase